MQKLLGSLKKSTRAMRSRKEFCPGFESELKEWVKDQRKESRRVSSVNIQLKGKQIAV